MRLLLIEDEQRLAEALAYILKKNKYAVDVAGDGAAGQELAESGIYDLIILDRMLPGKEGVEVLKELRISGINTPVLMLTAKDTVADRVAGLNAGADDYLVKPFATEELLARVKALGRRQREQLNGDRMQFSSLVLDPLRCEVSYGNETVKLTLKESQLLELFMRNPGQVLSKELILNRIWGLDTEVELNNVEMYIYYLRKKINFRQCTASIDTIRGSGYCLKVTNHV